MPVGPTITKITANTAPGIQSSAFTVTGTGFTAGSNIYAEQPSSNSKFTITPNSISAPTSIVFSFPSISSTTLMSWGVYNIQVVPLIGSASTAGTVILNIPTLSSVIPSSVVAGATSKTPVITGTNFSTVNNVIKFIGTTSTTTEQKASNATTLTLAKVPNLPTGNYQVSINNSTTTVTLSITNSAQTAESYYDFGGMYANGSDAQSYKNPATSAKSCPSGYSTTQVLGTTNIDYSIYACLRVHSATTLPLYDFGGMYSNATAYATTTYLNSATSQASCPDSFTPQQIAGHDGTTYKDAPLYYCYRSHTPGSAYYDLGGMYGYKLNGSYKNPQTSAISCPTAYTTVQTYGAVGSTTLDYQLKYCVKAITAKVLLGSPNRDDSEAVESNNNETVGTKTQLQTQTQTIYTTTTPSPSSTATPTSSPSPSQTPKPSSSFSSGGSNGGSVNSGSTINTNGSGKTSVDSGSTNASVSGTNNQSVTTPSPSTSVQTTLPNQSSGPSPSASPVGMGAYNNIQDLVGAVFNAVIRLFAW